MLKLPLNLFIKNSDFLSNVGLNLQTRHSAVGGYHNRVTIRPALAGLCTAVGKGCRQHFFPYYRHKLPSD